MKELEQPFEGRLDRCIHLERGAHRLGVSGKLLKGNHGATTEGGSCGVHAPTPQGASIALTPSFTIDDISQSLGNRIHARDPILDKKVPLRDISHVEGNAQDVEYLGEWQARLKFEAQQVHDFGDDRLGMLS